MFSMPERQKLKASRNETKVRSRDLGVTCILVTVMRGGDTGLANSRLPEGIEFQRVVEELAVALNGGYFRLEN
jgi:hypothetical protein